MGSTTLNYNGGKGPQLQQLPTIKKRRYRQRWCVAIVGMTQQRIQKCRHYWGEEAFFTMFMVSLLLVSILSVTITVNYLSSPSIGQVSFLNHPSSGNYIHHMRSTTVVPYQCAPWLTAPTERTVAFLDLSDMDTYYDMKKKMYRGGEFYMSASLDYALRENGFIVHRVGIKSILQELQQQPNDKENVLKKFAAKYYRIFTNGYDPLERLNNVSSLWNQPDLICKLRSIHWWGNTNEHFVASPNGTTASTSIDQLLPMLHHTQWLKPYPTADYHNTFIGYIPHSTILLPTYHRMIHRSLRQLLFGKGGIPEPRKVGLLFGKFSKSFRHGKTLIDALIADGFILHTTCTDCHDNTLPEQVIRHGSISPLQFIQLLQSEELDISFLLGFGYPYDSPSPVEALVNGVAFINPVANHASTSLQGTTTTFPSIHPLRSSQHVPIQYLGQPYVYNVQLTNITHVLAAANMAVQYRFHSFIPSEYHPLSMTTRVCTTLIEDDTLCTCSRLPKGRDVDCRPGSHTIRKSTTGNDANGVGNVSFY